MYMWENALKNMKHFTEFENTNNDYCKIGSYHQDKIFTETQTLFGSNYIFPFIFHQE